VRTTAKRTGTASAKVVRRAPRNVEEAIRAAEAIFPGRMVRGDAPDPRWQALFVIKEFLESDPEPIWAFIVRWGRHRSEDLRTGIALVLLEHLLPLHFESVFPRARKLARSNEKFAWTLEWCQSSFCAPRERRRLDRLQNELRPQLRELSRRASRRRAAVARVSGRRPKRRATA